MKNLFFFLAITLLFTACQSKTTPTLKPFNLDAAKATIIEANKTYAKRFVTNDPAFFAEKYCKDAIVSPPEHPQVMGLDSIRSYFYVGGDNSEINLDISNTAIYGNADVVVEEGKYDFPDGKGGSIDKGKFIALWKQEDNKWKMYREIWNTDVLPKPVK